MPETRSLAQAIRERSWKSHGASEGAGFMARLLKGHATRDDYTALVVQHFYMYDALEAAAAQLSGHPEFEAVNDARLRRMPAIEADLAHLMGEGWRTRISPVASVTRYAARIREVAAQGWAGGVIAHHYTRYLGDLSGGQHIKRVMQRHFDLGDDGVRFYIFDIDDIDAFKNGYRAELDRMPWDDAEFERVVDETLAAYQFNTDVFVDLEASRPTPALA
ncbi:heme oxygenase (biliverdin-producing) [Ruicaihuangia caeni]|uniref:Biliverdin-producing heme oxygenase n=1 Tax=Ruicaihuangia caeni TaxID=3042517 RepID=A0AAW6TAQ6_9MICO|nr:biliverdin-producing heme oxygenase [Klugiella sp. YN-L-19]MDI2099053.1 biliverdin-producing heme oxygenase [Klugiella sp. YN-L-19]